MSSSAMDWPSRVTLCEVGLRDGLQNEAALLTVEQKLQLLDAVIDSGVKVVEIGAFVHPKAVPQMADTEALFAAQGFSTILRRNVPSIQPGNLAAGVTWTWAALRKETPK